MIGIERAMEAVARETGRDPLDVRRANLYRPGADQTPYNQTVEDCETMPAILAELEASSDYRARASRRRRLQRARARSSRRASR